MNNKKSSDFRLFFHLISPSLEDYAEKLFTYEKEREGDFAFDLFGYSRFGGNYLAKRGKEGLELEQFYGENLSNLEGKIMYARYILPDRLSELVEYSSNKKIQKARINVYSKLKEMEFGSLISPFCWGDSQGIATDLIYHKGGIFTRGRLNLPEIDINKQEEISKKIIE